MYFWHEVGYHAGIVFPTESTALKPALHAADPQATSICHNCGTTASDNYCHHCGQERVLHPASAREFLHEFVGHYVALESRLWGTLSRLLFRPGALTVEYIQGRRVRFVQPLRLYLTLSVLFFALVKFTHGTDMPIDDTPAPTPAKVAQAGKAGAASAPSAAAAAVAHADKDADPDADEDIGALEAKGDQAANWLRSFWPQGANHLDRFDKLRPREKGELLGEGFYHFAPYALFCLMPFFALYMKVLYLGSGRRFGEHLLFALHTNAFAFAVLMLMLLPLPGIVKFALWIWLIGYLPWAMRRVYHSSRFGTAWRWFTLMTLHTLSIGIAFLFAVSAGVMTA
jgi:hypothetical protein